MECLLGPDLPPASLLGGDVLSRGCAVLRYLRQHIVECAASLTSIEYSVVLGDGVPSSMFHLLRCASS